MAYASYGNNSEQTPKDAQRPDKGAAAAKPETVEKSPGSEAGEAKDHGSEVDHGSKDLGSTDLGSTDLGSKDLGSKAAQDLPAAGPHADPDLTNDKATPGAGTLPAAGDQDATDATSG